MQTPEERFAHIEGELRRLEEHMSALDNIISGPPWERSLRARVHTIETSELATKAAEAALATARELRDRSYDRRFTKREKLVALALGSVMALSGLITTTLVVAQHFGGS